MIAWFMIGLLLAAETTCENETRIRDEMMKLKDGSKEASTANELEEDVYRKSLADRPLLDMVTYHFFFSFAGLCAGLTCYTCVNVSDNQVRPFSTKDISFRLRRTV